MLGAQGLWAGRDLYCTTPAVTRDLGFFFGLFRRTAPFSRLLRHTRGCGGSILARIFTGCLRVTSPCRLSHPPWALFPDQVNDTISVSVGMKHIRQPIT
jgi:hypothetical protein